MEGKIIYFDYVVIIFFKKEVLDEMMLYLIEQYGNFLIIYKFGREVKKVIEFVRERVVKVLNVDI